MKNVRRTNALVLEKLIDIKLIYFFLPAGKRHLIQTTLEALIWPFVTLYITSFGFQVNLGLSLKQRDDIQADFRLVFFLVFFYLKVAALLVGTSAASL